jgi:hypothetical protein
LIGSCSLSLTIIKKRLYQKGLFSLSPLRRQGANN